MTLLLTEPQAWRAVARAIARGADVSIFTASLDLVLKAHITQATARHMDTLADHYITLDWDGRSYNANAMVALWLACESEEEPVPSRVPYVPVTGATQCTTMFRSDRLDLTLRCAMQIGHAGRCRYRNARGVLVYFYGLDVEVAG